MQSRRRRDRPLDGARARSATGARRAHPPHADRTVAGALQKAARAGVPQARDAPADRIVQDPRRVLHDVPARTPTSAGAGSSRARPETTERPSRRSRASSGSPPRSTSPASVDESKYRGMLDLGARVVRSELRRLRRHRADRARRGGAKPGRPFLTAFDDAAMLAANGGTLAAEVLEDCPEARAFLVPVGGAGLAGGFAYYARTALPEARLDRLPARAVSGPRALARAGRGGPDAAARRDRRPEDSRAASGARASRPSRPGATASRC